jgi:hypothetical protein
VKHFIKDFKVLEDVYEVLLGIYNMYKLFDNSPKKFAVFKVSGSILGMIVHK